MSKYIFMEMPEIEKAIAVRCDKDDVPHLESLADAAKSFADSFDGQKISKGFRKQLEAEGFNLAYADHNEIKFAIGVVDVMETTSLPEFEDDLKVPDFPFVTEVPDDIRAFWEVPPTDANAHSGNVRLMPNGDLRFLADIELGGEPAKAEVEIAAKEFKEIILQSAHNAKQGMNP